MQALTAAVGFVVRGQVSAAGDLLMQRFENVETALHDRHWEVARQQELVPDSHHGASTLREKEAASKIALRQRQMRSLTE